MIRCAGRDRLKTTSLRGTGSIAFAATHANKLGIVLDLKTADGRSTLDELARCADVLIEDEASRSLAENELKSDALQTINPALVVTSISGFGLSGPYRDFKAPNIVAFALGGLMNVCGHPGRAPLVGPCDVVYRLASVHAAFGTLRRPLQPPRNRQGRSRGGVNSGGFRRRSVFADDHAL